jgi:Zn-dependent peptidase ImmA (M78 family)/transcriptional regulator with XRE-family HTH domain
MTINLEMIGRKLASCRNQLEETVPDVSTATGLSLERLSAIEAGRAEPTGDEILILADHFQCDFRYFISSDQVAPFEQIHTLFRRHGTDFGKADRRAIQEFVYLCETEAMLMEELGRSKTDFSFHPKGNYYKEQGKLAAYELRKQLGYSDRALPLDVYGNFRAIGVHVFRRRLGNSNISGVFIRHPTAGKCALVNYDEDVYRQRFSAAHEVAHSIFDHDQDASVSFESTKGDLLEVRANSFASAFLAPPAFLTAIPVRDGWSDEEARHWANKMGVNCQTLGIALSIAGLVNDEVSKRIQKLRIGKNEKVDPELLSVSSENERKRKSHLLELGLSDFYVELCFDGFQRGVISRGRLAEALLTTSSELNDLAKLYGRSIHGN